LSAVFINESESDHRPSEGAISLLVAEDDKIVRHLLSLIIPKKFPDTVVHLAENGRAGLDLFERHTPRIVLTDINMPVMNGIQMSRQIRALKPDAKIIVLTAYQGSEYTEQFDEIGVESYLAKPIVFEKLFIAIENCRR